MKRWSLAALAVAGALAAIMPGPASASGNPGCFGQFVSFYAQNPGAIDPPAANLGEFVSASASGPGAFGQVDVPFFKSMACG
jgi:hypothetical protein